MLINKGACYRGAAEDGGGHPPPIKKNFIFKSVWESSAAARLPVRKFQSSARRTRVLRGRVLRGNVVSASAVDEC